MVQVGQGISYPFQGIHRPKKSVGHVSKIHKTSQCFYVQSLSTPKLRSRILFYLQYDHMGVVSEIS